MALSIKKILLQALVIPGTVFCAATLPLAVFGSESVAIEFRDEPVFRGQLRQIASPYLALATAVSIGAGLAGVATTGWRQSHQRAAHVEEQLSALQQALKEKEIELENIKVSDSRLAAFGLSSFLEDDVEDSLVVTTDTIDVVTTDEATMVDSNHNFNSEQPVATLSQVTEASTTFQIEQLCSQLEKLTSHFASLQQNLQNSTMPVASLEKVNS